MSLLLLFRGEATTTAVGEWDQAPASWSATASEAITVTGSWEQAPATWQASEQDLITSTASWEQDAASWSATVAHSEPEEVVRRGGRNILFKRHVRGHRSTWQQAPASWSASVVVDNPVDPAIGRRAREDELVLMEAL